MHGRPADETARAMAALGMWKRLASCNWALKPHGVAFPYFCTTVHESGPVVEARFLMLDGWRSFHDFIRMRIDPNFGFYSSPLEIPHFETVFVRGGDPKTFRHAPGCVPRPPDGRESEICGRMMWEAYGVMMRIETDESLPMKYAGEQAMFLRAETAPGVWEDRPLPILQPPPHREQVSFPKTLVEKAKDLPLVQDESIELDFRMMPDVVTRESPARYAYQLTAIESATGARIVRDRVSVTPEHGLRDLWENMPRRALMRLVERGRIPGEIKVPSGRTFRMLRPLCMELPVKLSLHDSLPELDKAFAERP